MESMRQLRRYVDTDVINVRILQQKIDKVDTDKEALINHHHAYGEKSKTNVDDDTMRAYINPKVDAAVDLLDEAEVRKDDINEAKQSAEETRNSTAAREHELTSARLSVTSNTEIISTALTKLGMHADTEEPTEADANFAESSIKDVQSREEELIESWHKMRTLLTDEIVEESTKEKKFHETIYEACLKGHQLISKVRLTTNVDDDASSTTTTVSVKNHATLEKMKPPKFSGNIRDFARFKSDYEAIVTPSYK